MKGIISTWAKHQMLDQYQIVQVQNLQLLANIQVSIQYHIELILLL